MSLLLPNRRYSPILKLPISPENPVQYPSVPHIVSSLFSAANPVRLAVYPNISPRYSQMNFTGGISRYQPADIPTELLWPSLPLSARSLSCCLSPLRFLSQGKAAASRTEPIKIRTQRMVGEVPLPQARRKQMHLKGRMDVNPLQHIHEVDIGIDALQAARGQEALHDRLA
jgi:hypothetical protein